MLENDKQQPSPITRRGFYCHNNSISHVIHRTRSSMSFFSIQVGLFQVSLQNADSFLPHHLSQGEYIYAIS